MGKFEVISMMVTGIATVLYMTMFSGAGKSFVKELGHDINPHDTRDAFYWGRYVDWVLTTPLMLWDVLALAGAPSDDILAAVGVDVLMIAFGAIGAQTPSAQKWVFFICGMVCFGHVVKVLLKYTTVSTAGKGTSTLLQSSIHDHRALDSLPTCLDRLRRRTTCIPIIGSLPLYAHGRFSKMRLRIHDRWSTGCTRKDPSN